MARKIGVVNKDVKATRQVELARLSWQMQAMQAASKIDIEIQRTYNREMRKFYQQHVKIVGSADVAGWESFALFVLGCKPPDMSEDAPTTTTTPEGETHATDGS